mgnify:FL=1
MNEKIITLNGTEYIVKTDNGQSLTPELLTNIKNQLMIKMGITSNQESNIVKLGTPTCPTSPIPLNTVGTLTASITQGTAPFTYTWTITKPGGGTDTLPNSAGPHSYTFTLTGTYGINLTVTDSCPSGTLSDTAFCSVTVAPTTGSISFGTSPSNADIYLDGTLQTIKTGTIASPTIITGVSLNIAHPYTLSLAGYNNYTGSVTLTLASPNQTVTATLTLTPSYANWVISKGGASGLYHNLSAIGNIIDGYLGGISVLGFIVTLGNVGTTIDYYIG